MDQLGCRESARQSRPRFTALRRSGQREVFRIEVPDDAFDKSKLENGVLEPLRELGLIKQDED